MFHCLKASFEQMDALIDLRLALLKEVGEPLYAKMGFTKKEQ